MNDTMTGDMGQWCCVRGTVESYVAVQRLTATGEENSRAEAIAEAKALGWEGPVICIPTPEADQIPWAADRLELFEPSGERAVWDPVTATLRFYNR